MAQTTPNLAQSLSSGSTLSVHTLDTPPPLAKSKERTPSIELQRVKSTDNHSATSSAFGRSSTIGSERSSTAVASEAGIRAGEGEEDGLGATGTDGIKVEKLVVEGRLDLFRQIAAFCTTATCGMSDAALGALIDSWQHHYHKPYGVISLVFLANTAGYLLSCLSNSFVLEKFGLRYTLMMAAVFNIVGALILSFAPPFSVLALCLVLMGFASGINDSSCSTYVAFYKSHKLFMVFYASFGVGSALTPLVIGGLLSADIAWQRYYYIHIAICIIAAIASWIAFSKFEAPVDRQDVSVPTSVAKRLWSMVKTPPVIAGSIIVALAFAAGDAISGWITTFLVRYRAGPAASQRFVLSGYWAGTTVGRLLLSFPTDLFGDRIVLLYVMLAIGCCGVFQWVANVPVDGVAIAFAGFCMGPITPVAISAVSKRVQPSFVSPVVSTMLAAGLVSSSITPLVIGAVNGVKWVGAIDMTILVLLALTWGWSLKIRQKEE